MDLLSLLIIILVIAWIGGFALNIGGGIIHLLLVIALVVVVLRLVRGERL